jgi:SAM-dependent methyltransferase
MNFDLVADKDHLHTPILICQECCGEICILCGLCFKCDKRVAIEQGVLRLLNVQNRFYEGAYCAQIHFSEASINKPLGRIILPFINYGYLKKILDTIEPGGQVLELGCGGGIQITGERYRVTAVDLSLTSLQAVPKSYQHRIQADVMEVNFIPNTFDAIVASCFFEHLTPDDKDRLLEKFYSWLKPEGYVVLLFDTESLNPFFKILRKFPDLYHQCIIAHDGHVGLQPATTNRLLFQKHGFVEKYGIGLNRTIQHLPVYTWIKPYEKRLVWVGWLFSIASIFNYNRILAHGFTILVHLWDVTLGRVFPIDWSRLYLGVWVKKTPSIKSTNMQS